MKRLYDGMPFRPFYFTRLQLLIIDCLLNARRTLTVIGSVQRVLVTSCAFVWSYLWLRWMARTGIPIQIPSSDSPQIVMLVWGHLPTDPRVEREAKALATNGFRVKIVCPQYSPTPSPPPDWGAGIEYKILDHAVVLPLASCPWLLSSGMVKAAMAENPSAYHAHDLITVLPVLLAAAKKGVPCVCDFHEWYSENVSYNAKAQIYQPHSWLKRFIFRSVEKLALRNASRVVTVCDSIADALPQIYDPIFPVAVVRNIPPLGPLAIGSSPAIDIRKYLNIPCDKAILLYQGGVGPSRGLESLIQAMGMVQHAVLVIRGPGIEYFQEQYLCLAAQSGAADRVFCLYSVSSQRCVAEAMAADLGFWTLMPICKNFTYALPNKVFEYLAAGLPIVCAHHPEVAKIVEGFDVGRCFDPEDPRSIAEAVNQLAGDAGLRRRCQANIHKALAELQAECEWAKLVDLYRGLTQPDLAANRRLLSRPDEGPSNAPRQKAG